LIGALLIATDKESRPDLSCEMNYTDGIFQAVKGAFLQVNNLPPQDTLLPKIITIVPPKKFV